MRDRANARFERYLSAASQEPSVSPTLGSFFLRIGGALAQAIRDAFIRRRNAPHPTQLANRDQGDSSNLLRGARSRAASWAPPSGGGPHPTTSSNESCVVHHSKIGC